MEQEMKEPEQSGARQSQSEHHGREPPNQIKEEKSY